MQKLTFTKNKKITMKKILLVLLLLLFGCSGTTKQTLNKDSSPEKNTSISDEQKLINLISDENDGVAMKAISILGRQDCASKAVVQKYEDMFRNCKNYSRIEDLLDAIYLYENQIDFLPGLEICLKSANGDTREEAIDIIGGIEEKEAIDALIKALSSKYSIVNEEAQYSLELLTDKEFKSQLQWKTWWKKNRQNFQF